MKAPERVLLIFPETTESLPACVRKENQKNRNSWLVYYFDFTAFNADHVNNPPGTSINMNPAGKANGIGGSLLTNTSFKKHIKQLLQSIVVNER
ncbi:MAG: hypothetical protein SGI83_06855 [Bacteroidota bacterium]|nr:hypothetical protein [Bacteroidota bacterium]